MASRALQEIEQLHARTFGRGARSIGITSASSKAGSTTIAKSLATRCTLSGQKTLFVDMSTPLNRDESNQPHPGQQNEGWTPGFDGLGQNIFKGRAGYDILPINPEGANRFRYSDARELQKLLSNELGRYEQVVIDLSPVPDVGRSAIPSGAGAAACDAVVLVCRTCVDTHATVETAVDFLGNHEAKVAGIVMNDKNAPTIAEELIREFNRLRYFIPKPVFQPIQNFVKKWLLGIDLINKKM